jgi:leucyl aminopeptidase
MRVVAKVTAKTDKRAHVVFISRTKDHPNLGSLPKAWGQALQGRDDFEAKPGEMRVFRDAAWADGQTVIVVGLGEKSGLKSEAARRAIAQVTLRARDEKLKSLALHADGLASCEKDPETLFQAIAEGLFLCLYRFDELKTKSEEEKKKAKDDVFEVDVLSPKSTGAATKGFAAGEVLARHMNFARRLGDMPPNLMTPEILAKAVQSHAQGSKVKVAVWDRARIVKEKFGGLLGVSLGSGNDPRFIVCEYNGGGSKKPIAFVGKGLTFDSGGISIKPSEAMDEMRYDMCGATNVVAATFALAELGVKQNIICLIAATENMPGPLANKPGDVLTARNGKTIEVLNTDAEGRVILADALSYACEQKPELIIDAATLTGAMVVALGFTYTGFFTKSEKLAKALLQAADDTGENLWRMPMHEEYSKDVKGHYGDVQNIAKTGRSGGACTAAAFLEHFVDQEIPWAHFDIAGTAWNTGKVYPYNPGKGASGVMIRTLVDFAKNWKHSLRNAH